MEAVSVKQTSIQTATYLRDSDVSAPESSHTIYSAIEEAKM